MLLSSHLLDQVQRICDRVGVFVRGQLVACGPIATLGQQLLQGEPFVVEVVPAPGAVADVAAALARLRDVQRIVREGDILLVECNGDARDAIAREAAPLGLLGLRLRGVALEDIYLKYFRQGE